MKIWQIRHIKCGSLAICKPRSFCYHIYGYRPVSLERAVKCPHCGHEENVDLEDFMYDESSYEKENGMGRILCTALILKIAMNVQNVATH